MLERLRCSVTHDSGPRGPAAFRAIFVHEGIPLFHTLIVLPLRILRILKKVGRDDALGGLQIVRLQPGNNRRRHTGEEVDGLPVDLIRLLDCQRSEFRYGNVQKDIGSRCLEVCNLGIDVGIRGNIGLF